MSCHLNAFTAPLATILGGKSNAIVLGELLHPGRTLTAGSLSRAAHLPLSQVTTALAALTRDGLIAETAERTPPRYQAAIQHPQIDSLRVLFASEFARYRAAIAAIRAATEAEGIVSCWLHDGAPGTRELCVVLAAVALGDIPLSAVSAALLTAAAEFSFTPIVSVRTCDDIEVRGRHWWWRDLTFDFSVQKGPRPEILAATIAHAAICSN